MYATVDLNRRRGRVYSEGNVYTHSALSFVYIYICIYAYTYMKPPARLPGIYSFSPAAHHHSVSVLSSTSLSRGNLEIAGSPKRKNPKSRCPNTHTHARAHARRRVERMRSGRGVMGGKVGRIQS